MRARLDPNTCQTECQNICQIECEKECRNRCQICLNRFQNVKIDARLNVRECQKECQQMCQKVCQTEWQTIWPNRMSEYANIWQCTTRCPSTSCRLIYEEWARRFGPEVPKSSKSSKLQTFAGHQSFCQKPQRNIWHFPNSWAPVR